MALRPRWHGAVAGNLRGNLVGDPDLLDEEADALVPVEDSDGEREPSGLG